MARAGNRFGALADAEAEAEWGASGDNASARLVAEEREKLGRAKGDKKAIAYELASMADACRRNPAGPLAKVLALDRRENWLAPDPVSPDEAENDANTSEAPPRVFGLDLELVAVRRKENADDKGRPESAHVMPDGSCVARVSLVEIDASTGAVLSTPLDAYVRPPKGYEVADYRTHVSGVTEEHLFPNGHKGKASKSDSVLKNPTAARDAVFRLVQRRDVICVHSGTTDLMALALLPARVYDTAGVVEVEDAPRWTLSLKDIANHVMGSNFHARREGLVGEVLGCGVPSDSSFQSHWSVSHDSTLDALWCARVAVGIALRKLAGLPPARKMLSLPDAVQSRWGIAGIPPGWDVGSVRKLVYYLLFRGPVAQHNSATFERIVESLKSIEVKVPKFGTTQAPPTSLPASVAGDDAAAAPAAPRPKGGSTQVEFAEPAGALSAYQALVESQTYAMDHNGHVKKGFAMTPQLYAWCSNSKSADEVFAALVGGARRILEDPSASTKRGKTHGRKRSRDAESEPAPPGVDSDDASMRDAGAHATAVDEDEDIEPGEVVEAQASMVEDVPSLPPFVEIRLFQRVQPDVVLHLDRREAGRVIGKGGRRVRHIKALSHAEVRVHPASGEGPKARQTLEIWGTATAVAEARKLVRCAAAGDALGIE